MNLTIVVFFCRWKRQLFTAPTVQPFVIHRTSNTKVDPALVARDRNKMYNEAVRLFQPLCSEVAALDDDAEFNDYAAFIKAQWRECAKAQDAAWMKRYDVSLWDVSVMIANGIPIQNRTNNPLEKYNRDFGGKFPKGRPSLFTFAEKAKADAVRFAQLIDDIKKGRAQPPAHRQEVEIAVPEAYTQFE
jgi:hypothetical protein